MYSALCYWLCSQWAFIIELILFVSVILCVCVCVWVCVCVCICPWQRPRVCCLAFIIPAPISAKLKFCIASSRLRASLLLPAALWAMLLYGLTVCCGCLCLIEWLVWFDERERRKHELTLAAISFHVASCTFCSICDRHVFSRPLNLPLSLAIALSPSLCVSPTFLCPSLCDSPRLCSHSLSLPSNESQRALVLSHTFVLCLGLSLSLWLSLFDARTYTNITYWYTSGKKGAMPARFVTTSLVTKTCRNTDKKTQHRTKTLPNAAVKCHK